MLSMVLKDPVSPPPTAMEDPSQDSSHEEPLLCQPCTEEDNLLVGVDNDVDMKLVQLDDPSVGVERIVADEHGAGASVA